MKELILASTSEWRVNLLRSAGIAVRAEPSDVDESGVQSSDPVYVAEHLALLKARSVARRFEDRVVLGADQVVFDGAEVFGKPTDPADHLSRLRSMRGRVHRLVTGVAILAPGVERVFSVQTDLAVRADLSDDELAAYVATGEGSGCAGGYAIEGHGAWLFESVQGDWNNIIGLPLFSVLSVLRELGWRYDGGVV